MLQKEIRRSRARDKRLGHKRGREAGALNGHDVPVKNDYTRHRRFVRRPVPTIDILLARTFRENALGFIRENRHSRSRGTIQYNFRSPRARVIVNLAGTIACHPIVLSINRINRHARHVYRPCILRGRIASCRADESTSVKPRKPPGT